MATVYDCYGRIKNLSQGDIEKRTGLMPSYISCVENGHTVPTVETLEKMAQAMDMHLYQFLYEGPEPRALPEPGKADRDGWGSSGNDSLAVHLLCIV